MWLVTNCSLGLPCHTGIPKKHPSSNWRVTESHTEAVHIWPSFGAFHMFSLGWLHQAVHALGNRNHNSDYDKHQRCHAFNGISKPQWLCNSWEAQLQRCHARRVPGISVGSSKPCHNPRASHHPPSLGATPQSIPSILRIILRIIL